jgi:hypothetical protein
VSLGTLAAAERSGGATGPRVLVVGSSLDGRSATAQASPICEVAPLMRDVVRRAPAAVGVEDLIAAYLRIVAAIGHSLHGPLVTAPLHIQRACGLKYLASR